MEFDKGENMMAGYPYDVGAYNSFLKSQITTLIITGIVLFLLFIFVTVLCVSIIKKIRPKKLPKRFIKKFPSLQKRFPDLQKRFQQFQKWLLYIILVLIVIVEIFLIVSLALQCKGLKKDIEDEAYIQYMGSVFIDRKGGTGYGTVMVQHTEYIISFEQDGEKVELPTGKDYGLRGYVEKVYIVYSQNSKIILEFIE